MSSWPIRPGVFGSELGLSQGSFFAAADVTARSPFNDRIYSEAFGGPLFQSRPIQGPRFSKPSQAGNLCFKCCRARFSQSFLIESGQFRPFATPGPGHSGPDELAANP